MIKYKFFIITCKGNLEISCPKDDAINNRGNHVKVYHLKNMDEFRA